MDHSKVQRSLRGSVTLPGQFNDLLSSLIEVIKCMQRKPTLRNLETSVCFVPYVAQDY